MLFYKFQKLFPAGKTTDTAEPFYAVLYSVYCHKHSFSRLFIAFAICHKLKHGKVAFAAVFKYQLGFQQLFYLGIRIKVKAAAVAADGVAAAGFQRNIMCAFPYYYAAFDIDIYVLQIWVFPEQIVKLYSGFSVFIII